MESEIIPCKCGEKILNYVNDEVVSESCQCKRKPVKIDFEKLQQELISMGIFPKGPHEKSIRSSN